MRSTGVRFVLTCHMRTRSIYFELTLRRIERITDAVIRVSPGLSCVGRLMKHEINSSPDYIISRARECTDSPCGSFLLENF